MERIKLILYAVLIGLFWDGLVILLHPFFNFIICVLVSVVVANLLIYKVFMVKNKTAYALICIPSVYYGLFLCYHVLEMIFKDVIKFEFGIVLVWYYSMPISIVVCIVLIIVRRLITKRNENKNV